MDDTHVFTPTFVMDVRVSDARFLRAQKPNPAGQNWDLTQLGFPAYIEKAIAPQFHQFPGISITDLAASSGQPEITARTVLDKQTETRELTVSFDKIKGKHDFRFGLDFRQYPDDQVSGSTATDLSLTYGATYTNGPLDNSPAAPRGQAMAQFLYGIPTSGSLLTPAASNFADMDWLYAPFFQDDWKITRKLTLNLGVRYEYETPERERYNRAVMGFNPNAGQPWAEQVLANYAQNPTPEIPASQFLLTGGLTFPGVNGHGQGLYHTDGREVEPRLGFAYQLGSHTVIRGGFGSYFGSLGTRLQDVIQTGFLATTNVIPTTNGGVTYSATNSNPFPNGLVQATGATLGSQTYVGNAISFFNQNPKAARLEKFQIDIEHELPGHVLLDVGYAGARDYDLEVSRSLSALPDQYLSTLPTRDQTTINYLTASLPNPFYGVPQFAGTTRGGSSTIARSILLSPYPQYAGVSYFSYNGLGWYDALNVRVEKRFSHGFSAQLNYTFSKYLEATSYLNPGDAGPSKAPSSQDYPNHWSITGIYHFPFGQAQRFLSHVPSVANILVTNWQIAPIYTYQSGVALGFGDAILNCPLSTVPISGKNTSKIHQWFNTSCFNTVASQQLANNLINLSARFGGIRGDSYNSWDAALIKNTRIRESMGLEVRVEALNVFNQVNFAAPNTSPTSTAFGQVTVQNNVPRHLQLSLRFKFE